MKKMHIVGRVLKKRVKKAVESLQMLFFCCLMIGVVMLPGVLVAALFFGTSAEVLAAGGFASLMLVGLVLMVIDAVKKFRKDYREEEENWDD